MAKTEQSSEKDASDSVSSVSRSQMIGATLGLIYNNGVDKVIPLVIFLLSMKILSIRGFESGEKF